MAVNKKKPNPVDVHVGSRVRLRRTMLSMSQEKLGEHLGITFQQIQKYEKGMNRIGASRLQKISEVLCVPVSFFFEGLPDEGGTTTGFEEQGAEYVVDPMNSPESVQLNRAFSRISNPKLRKRIVELVRAMADGETPQQAADQANG